MCHVINDEHREFETKETLVSSPRFRPSPTGRTSLLSTYRLAIGLALSGGQSKRLSAQSDRHKP